MASQRDIRRRIQSSKNIKQITRAMQFVAASKLKRAQDATLAARPYSEKLDEVLADLAAVLEAKASEESSRMVAMKNATENAEELIEDLTLSYNKVRQSNITREMIEIASGANAR